MPGNKKIYSAKIKCDILLQSIINRNVNNEYCLKKLKSSLEGIVYQLSHQTV